LATGAFQRVIADADADPKRVSRVLVCSGKVYYDLADERRKLGRDDIAVVRVEQLYPFPEQQLSAALSRFKKAEVVWVQEEPENMGAATFIFPRIVQLLGGKQMPLVIARAAAASPATGSKDSHDLEQSLLLKKAFGLPVERKTPAIKAVQH
jgi:2-oxoglutarate dehydrogenase E1 component